MGGSQSLQIPGGGTEGYHVLRVTVSTLILGVQQYKLNNRSILRFKTDRRANEPDSNLFSILLLPLEVQDW